METHGQPRHVIEVLFKHPKYSNNNNNILYFSSFQGQGTPTRQANTRMMVKWMKTKKVVGTGNAPHGVHAVGDAPGRAVPRSVHLRGGLPRSLRVSEFKEKIHDRSVQPLRVVWHGGSGHAFLQFQNADVAEDAIEALKDLDINGRQLKVELARSNRETNLARRMRKEVAEARK